MRESRIQRRRLLAGTMAGTTGLLVLRSRRSGLGYQANERLNLAVVGVAGYCAASAFMPAVHIYENVGISALCDVDQRKVAPALKIWDERAAQWPSSSKEEERKGAEHYQRLAKNKPPLFEDFRVMLDKMAGQIDAVVVATPDHTHAVGSAAALRAGKPVLCEKPLTITVEEARALRELAVRQKVATSMGNQGTQSPQFRRGLELIREGAIGPVEQVHVWFSRGGADLKQRPQGTQPVPKELNWDLWLGPVAWREYHPEWIARTNWRDTSLGQLGNFGPHTANLAFMALAVADLWQPGPPGTGPAKIEVEAECPNVNRLSFPVWEKIRWRVPSRGKLPPVTFTWHHGRTPDYAPGSRGMLQKMLHDYGVSDAEIKKLKLLVYAGAIIVGSKGALITDSHNVNITLFPRRTFEGVEIDKPKSVASSRGHYRDWLHACRGGEAPWARFEYSATLNEFLVLGDVATRFAGEALEYDPIAGKIVNHAAANQALGYEYRKGWRL
jgi:predicted dehydrogenase